MWTYDKTYLCHWGILGMKWGVRRYQNPDGSLTAAGKKRYSYQNAKDDIQQIKSSKADLLEKTKKMGNAIPVQADILGGEYDKVFKSMKFDEKDRKEILKRLEKDYGSGCDDEEYFNWDLEDHIRDMVSEKADEMLKDKIKEFNSLQDQYWDNVHELTNDIIEKYKDTTITGTGLTGYYTYVNNGSQIVSDLINKEMLDRSINSYIYRHFDDYWVNDTDAHYEAMDRVKKELGITMEEYNNIQKRK